jgi:hypothetical protein
MGNFLNHGTNKASNYGFPLDTFNKMRDLRSTDGRKMTLMNHSLGVVIEQHSDVASLFESELELVTAVSQCTFLLSLSSPLLILTELSMFDDSAVRASAW